MPLTLILLRHAKSDWSAGAAGDHERPLNARGERAAAVVGIYLRQQGLAPDLVLTSTAVRARTTAELVLFHGRIDAELRMERELYLADPQTILGVVRRAAGQQQRILLVAHNPGLEELVQALAEGGSAREPFPTAAMAICKTAVSWAETGRASLVLGSVVRPNSLL